MGYDCLIVEGGGFKTAFTAGVLDAFITAGYFPFKGLIGISGGSVALSYFLSGQYRYCIRAMRTLAKDKQFADYKRAFREKGYLDIDYIATVASEKVPFNVIEAVHRSQDLHVSFVATDRIKGKPAYIQPNKEQWIQSVIASSTLPFATKGKHLLDGQPYFDGGWSDPLPVKWAYNHGYKKILVLRTRPKSIKIKQSWADYFGSKYFSDMPELSKIFESAFETYNEAIDFISEPPEDLIVTQIDPKRMLNSGVYSYSKKTLMLDYRYGLDKGITHLQSI